MIESITQKLWQKLAEKEIALAMVYGRDGSILWHRGREVTGTTIEDGSGFSKSVIRQTIREGRGVELEDEIFEVSGSGLPRSAQALRVRSLIIQRIDEELFLYVDSGRKEPFDASERELIRFAGELLSESIGISRPTPSVSPAKDRLERQISKFALADLPILLTGETGVGKNHVARLIHERLRPRMKIVEVHTPGLTDDLVASELFGHKKGVFTGADRDKEGLVAFAEGGTLFLDEIADVPLSIQAKLLQLLDTRTYRMLGDLEDRTADVRIIGATRRELEEEVAQGRFREDLFYRLSVLTIEIPPLRQRKEEIPEILEARSDWLLGKVPGPGFFDALKDYDWPGNIRQLRNVVTRAAVECEGEMIGAEVRQYFGGAPKRQTEMGMDPVEEALGKIQAGASFWDTAWRDFIGRDLNRAQLRTLLERSYLENGQSLTAMSRALNITPQQYNRFVSALHRYDVRPAKTGG